MLHTLSGYEPKFAQRLLSKFASSILQQTSIPDQVRLTKDEEKIRNQLFLEIKKNKHLLDLNDTDEKVRFEVLESLSNEISRLCYDFNSLDKIMEVVGKAGALEPNQYKVKFPENFEENHKELGLTSELVAKTINHPDSYEHFQAKNFYDPRIFAHSIFVKLIHENNKNEKSFICLVMCRRINDIQRINNAWKISPSLVNFNNRLTPIEILSIFVEKFGLSLKIGNKINKFFVNESVPIEAIKTSEPKVVGKKPRNYMMSFDIQTIHETKMVIIGCAFAIDIDKYLKYLKESKLQ